MVKGANDLDGDAYPLVPQLVDFDDQATRLAWSFEFGATEAQLHHAAARVGRMPAALRFYLGHPLANFKRLAEEKRMARAGAPAAGPNDGLPVRSNLKR